jgi:riboflavin kinase/FMN adenylyltransferase
MNVNLHRIVSPLQGVYAVQVIGLQQTPLPGVANIGNRPTVGGVTRYLLEVHLFEFNRSVYGEHVQVEFVRKLRDEQRFESFDALRRQIHEDAHAARNILGLAETPRQHP